MLLRIKEVLLDEDGSRSSSRVREHEIFLLVWKTACDNPDTLKSMNVYFLALTDGSFTFNGSHRSYMVCVYVFVCVFCLHLRVQQTLAQLETGRPVLTIVFLVFGWVCWESLPPPTTSEPNPSIQLSLKEIFGGSQGDAYTFSHVILQFPSW